MCQVFDTLPAESQFISLHLSLSALVPVQIHITPDDYGEWADLLAPILRLPRSEWLQTLKRVAAAVIAAAAQPKTGA